MIQRLITDRHSRFRRAPDQDESGGLGHPPRLHSPRTPHLDGNFERSHPGRRPGVRRDATIETWVSPMHHTNVAYCGRLRTFTSIGRSIGMAEELLPLRLHMSSSRSLVVVVVACLAIACAGSSSAPMGPSSLSGGLALTGDQIAGTWNLLSIRRAGQADQATPAGASYTLIFADGRLSTRVDCNVCSGEFALSGQTLTAGPALACTRAACPTMAFDNAYTELLGGDNAVTLSNDTLVLSSVRGVLRFRR